MASLTEEIIASNTRAMDRKLVIIPTYNEKENIEKIVRKVFSLEGGYHILIIDDGSPFKFGLAMHFDSLADQYKTEFSIEVEAELNFMMKAVPPPPRC